MTGASEKNCILVVEDDPQVANLIKMVLEDLGITNILTADDGDVAQKLFDTNIDTITAVISDWNLPGASGLDLLKAVRAVSPTLPFILLTGRDSIDSTVAAAGSGVSRYLYKPFSPNKLEQAILSILPFVNSDTETEEVVGT